jgi:hypothetical protein
MPSVSPDGLQIIAPPSETLLLLGQVIAKVDTVLENQREARADHRALEVRVTALEHWKTQAMATGAMIAMGAAGLWQLVTFLWNK